MTDFDLCGARLTARPSGALWWAEARLLGVADLHLGKSERLARRGGTLLPPYESLETLARLEAEVAALDPRTVICLGDSFDDRRAGEALCDDARAALARMMAGRRWIWIAGNHDAERAESGGTWVEEIARGPLVFRHIARPRAAPGEVSGHFHPKLTLVTRAGAISRPCFVRDAARLMLPAFGTYTGGLPCTDPPVASLFGPDAVCILTGRATASVPLPRRQTA